MLKYQRADITKDAYPGAETLSSIVLRDLWHHPLSSFPLDPNSPWLQLKRLLGRRLSLGAVQLPARGRSEA